MNNCDAIKKIENETLRIHDTIGELAKHLCTVEAVRKEIHFYSEELAEQAFTAAQAEGNTMTYLVCNNQYTNEGGEIHFHLTKPNGVNYTFVLYGTELPEWAKDAINEEAEK